MAEEAEDRISALPEVLQCHILSFLPIVYAVRTTVLSRRWKDKWTSIPSIEFSDEHFHGHLQHSLSFVNRVLLFRDSSSDIHKLSISISGDLYFGLDQAALSYLDDWICTAVRCKLVELEVSGFAGMPYDMPESLLMCRTIKVLNLSKLGAHLTFDPSAPGSCFPSLKSLSIVLPHGENEWNKLIHCCPVLEELTIDGVLGSMIDRSHNIRVDAPELKTLITRCQGSSLMFHANFNLYIIAPKLESLHIENPLLPKLYLDVRPSFVTVTLPDLGVYEVDLALLDQQGFALEPIQVMHDLVIRLLHQMSESKYLSLSAYVLQVHHIPAFCNLTRLNLLLLKCNYWELIADLLHKAPNLEDIDIEDGTEYNTEKAKFQWNPPEVVPNCLSSRLKSIYMFGFRGRQVEMKVMKYLLKNGRLLERFTVDFGPFARYLSDHVHHRLRCEFYILQRSVTCHLGVHY